MPCVSPLLLVLALALPIPAAAAPPNVRLNTPVNQTIDHQILPVVLSRGDKLLAVWTDIQISNSPTEQRIQYAVSTDSGATFTDRGTVPAPVTANTWRWRGDAQLAYDAATAQVILVGYVSTIVGTPTRHGIGWMRGQFSADTIIWLGGQTAREWTSSPTIYDQLAFAISPLDGSKHLAYLDVTGVVMYQTSPDMITWTSPQTLSSVADQGGIRFVRMGIDSPGNVHVSWAGRPAVANQPIRYRRGFNSVFGAEETPAIMRMNPMLPGKLTVLMGTPSQRPAFSMAVTPQFGATNALVAFAWGETWDFSDELFSPLTTTFLRNEVEPNDTSVTATPFQVGDALIGTRTPAEEEDFWAVNLAAGQGMLLWSDSITTGETLRINGPDGVTLIANGQSGTAPSTFSFVAPVAGPYFIRLAFGGFGYYRIRTRTGSPGTNEARDARDIAVVYLDHNLQWSPIRRYTFGAVGYDDYMPTIGFGSDRLDYVTWYDMGRDGPYSSRAHLVVARNLVGIDPVASPPQIVTSVPNDFSRVIEIIPPGIGSTNRINIDPRRVFLSWTDARDSTADTYTTSLKTDAFLMSCPEPVAAAAGKTAVLECGVMNRNQLFEEKVRIMATGARSWPGLNYIVRDSVPPGTTGPVQISIDVPDTAAVGVYPLTLTVTRQGLTVLGQCQTALVIGPPVAVEPGAKPAVNVAAIRPNPTAGATEISFVLAADARTRVVIYGVRGERVRTLLDGEHPAGAHSLRWDGRDASGRFVAPGIYVVRFEAPGWSATRRIAVVR